MARNRKIMTPDGRTLDLAALADAGLNDPSVSATWSRETKLAVHAYLGERIAQLEARIAVEERLAWQLTLGRR